ncbi:MAG: BON domain-containing protein [Pseudomonadota bacterium]
MGNGSGKGNDLVARLSAAFERDAWINQHRYPVKIRAVDGRVALEGTLENVAAKRRALALTQQIVGDAGLIDDYLRRDPKERMGDRQLRNEVVQRMATESVFARYTLGSHTGDKFEVVHDGGPDSYQIEVWVDAGAVTLNGVVESLSHRRLAESLAWWAHGCETVDNQLAVTPPQEDADDEITDAVRIVLEKDPAVHAEQLRVGTAAAVVHLDGLVATTAERQAALLDAWSVEGVWNVVDRIEVRS